MTWRDPNDPAEWRPASPENLVELAAAYSPLLRYGDAERFYPVLAESWLTHVGWAPWEASDVDPGDVPYDPYRRGTALCHENPTSGDISPVAGSSGPRVPALRLAGRTDAASIGHYDNVDAHTFLDVGGWLPGSGRRSGDDEYLAAVFSELAAAMNPARRWNPVDGLPHLPHTWVPQPVTPTTYCEVEWGGMYPRWSHDFRTGDFAAVDSNSPDDLRDLDGYMVLTYYYLYPARVPSPSQGGPRKLEGQWEAVSLFFECDPIGAPGPSGRPAELLFHEPPRWVAASAGQDRTTGDHDEVKHFSRVRPWLGRDGVPAPTFETVHAHPVLYVATGTHRHQFTAESGTRWASPEQPGSDGLVYDSGGGEFPGREVLVLWSVALAGFAGFLFTLGPLAAILAVIVLIIALLLLIAWLISLIWEAVNQASGDPLPEAAHVDEATGDGPEAGSDEEPAGAAVGSGPDPGGAAPVPPGSPNAGSPTGRDTVSFDVRVVDMLHLANGVTSYPPESITEHPAWWRYTGAWGVNVVPACDSDWESGTRRVDEFRRSWGYWHGLRVVGLLHGS